MASIEWPAMPADPVTDKPKSQPHLEVRVGTIETESGGRQVFSAVARSDTDIKVLIGRNLDAVGRTEGTVLTAFTDGCRGFRRTLADAGVTEVPTLDWFHIGMRLQHLKQIASSLSADDPARGAAKTAIHAEVEQLQWRIWNGKAKNAGTSIDRIRAVMHHFQCEPGSRKSIAPPRKLWTDLQALDGYLTGPGDWLDNYAERHRSGSRVGTAITEGTANFLVNRRMNRSRCDGRDVAPISCCRLVALPTMARSVPLIDRNSTPRTIRPRRLRSPPDPQSWGSPTA